MRRFLEIRTLSLSALAFGLGVLIAWPAQAQQYQVARPVYAAPRPQVVQTQPRGGLLFSGPDLRRQRPSANIPYTRSPYTDDWSTGRNLPYPKPWMRPRR